jgi:hypothetical protein
MQNPFMGRTVPGFRVIMMQTVMRQTVKIAGQLEFRLEVQLKPIQIFSDHRSAFPYVKISYTANPLAGMPPSIHHEFVLDIIICRCPILREPNSKMQSDALQAID